MQYSLMDSYPMTNFHPLNAVYRTYQEQWPIGMDVERESMESIPSESLDNNDEASKFEKDK